jgi:DNA-binding transcriptional ArsR family regulator
MATGGAETLQLSARSHGDPAMKIYWIERREQIEALSSPTRQDIADRLGAVGPCTVAVLAAALGYRPTALYQHLVALKRVGLVVTLPRARARGRPATQYRLVAPLIRWARAPRLERNRRPMARVARAMATRAAKDYALGFDASHWAIEGPGRNHWIFRLVTRLSRRRLRRINVLLDEVARLAYTPDPRPGPLVSIACLLSPIPEQADFRRRTHGQPRD